MTTTRLPLPTISAVFDDYFATATARARPLTAGRIRAVRTHLESFLDEHAGHILTEPQQLIVRSEQQFGARGAFARTMFPEDLFYALYCYLNPKFRLPGPIDAGCQLRVISGLTRWMWTRGLLENLNASSCIVLDVEVALKHARRALIVAREAAAREALAREAAARQVAAWAMASSEYGDAFTEWEGADVADEPGEAHDPGNPPDPDDDRYRDGQGESIF